MFWNSQFHTIKRPFHYVMNGVALTSIMRPRLRPSGRIAKDSLKSERAALRKRLLDLVEKSDDALTAEDRHLLDENANFVKILLRNRERRAVRERRCEEIEETDAEVFKKCEILARALRESDHVVVYTGAGISTSADIPDYRGPEGVWTLLKGGKKLPAVKSLTSSKPTRSHMCLQKLFNQGLVKHIVSQNCDGLHLRSGIPTSAMSEVHGNMYAEVCQTCQYQVYHRVFDVTSRTSFRRHKTGRSCDSCGSELRDTIVHFGERSNLRWPHNWEGAVANAQKCDMILCLGSSLKILRSYKQLWMMNRPKHKRPDLYIVNLQWTPKDSQAKMKVHAKIDYVLSTVLKLLDLDVPNYNWETDPLLSLSTPCGHDGSTIPIPKLFNEKFQQFVKRNGLPTNEISIKSESEPDSNESKPGLSSKNGDSSSNVLMDTAAPSWFGKGLKSKLTASKCRKRKRLVKV